jgi:hypothetical protein
MVLAAAFAIAFAVRRLATRRASSPPALPPGKVPAAWVQFRTSLGHTEHVGEKGVTCGDCHDYEHDGFKNPGPAPCVRCHAKEGARFDASHVTTMTNCLTCHAFAPEQKTPTCIGCHAQPEGSFAAIKTTHATTNCTTCHSPHGDPSVVTAACESCHTERAPEHAAHAGSAGCGDCHKPHAAATVALEQCSTCHKEPAEPKPAGHDSCTDCHKPHAFVAGASACIGCHGAKETLLAATAAAHAVCTSCHAHHDPASAAGSCVGCHATVNVSHGDKTACITCHEPHAGNANAKAVTCTSCHGNVSSTDTGAHAGHTLCTACHKPHDFEPPKIPFQLCTNCHAHESTLASTNKGHADCTSCHGTSAHAPKTALTCGTCHTKEEASAPKGHQACAGCHDPHSGDHLPAATCGSCHADKIGGPHDALKNGCETCHRPHGPSGISKAPVCTTCHGGTPLAALHTVPAHAECASCHSPHRSTPMDRATCTGTCHADRRQHQPQAQVCTGCHAFIR